MNGGLIESAARAGENPERRIMGVAAAQVINNVDSQGLGRVQLSLPWLPGIEPWARVAVPQAGSDHGVYFIPQIGDEVLVAFHHGDMNEPFVIGSLWNSQDKPPATAPQDPTMTRLVRSPLGHEILLDDLRNVITIKTSSEQTITLDPQKVEVATTQGSAKITLTTAGAITIESSISIELKAPSITLSGSDVTIDSTASADIQAGASCSIQAAIVRIN